MICSTARCAQKAWSSIVNLMYPLWLRRIPRQPSQRWPVYYLLSQIQQHNNRRIGQLHIRRRTFMKFCFKVWSQIVECFTTFFFLSKSRDRQKRMPRDQDSLDACPEIGIHKFSFFKSRDCEKGLCPKHVNDHLLQFFVHANRLKLCQSQEQIKGIIMLFEFAPPSPPLWDFKIIQGCCAWVCWPACMAGVCMHAWLGVCCLYNITIWAKFSLHIIHWPRAIVALVNVMTVLTVPLLFCQSSHVIICFAFSLGSQKAWL